MGYDRIETLLKTKKNHMNTAWILNTVIQPMKHLIR